MSYPLVRELAAHGLSGAADLRGARLLCPGLLQVAARTRSRRARLRRRAPRRRDPRRPRTTTPSSATASSPTSSSVPATASVSGGSAGCAREHKIWSTTTKKGRKGAGKTPRTGGPRRPRAAELHRSRAGPGVADRHHRAPNRRGQALRLRASKTSARTASSATRPLDRMTADLATSALRQAVARRQPTGTVVVHSDRGGQFRSRAFRAVLKANDLTGSMGRVSSAGDNAAMESFYSLLAEERPRPPALEDALRARLRDRLLDRAHLQPPSPSARTRQAHPRRVRARLRARLDDEAA